MLIVKKELLYLETSLEVWYNKKKTRYTLQIIQMKEEVEIGELDAQRPIPVVFAVPEYKEFVRGGVAAFSNIVGNEYINLLKRSHISCLQGHVSSAIIRKRNNQCF